MLLQKIGRSFWLIAANAAEGKMYTGIFSLEFHSSLWIKQTLEHHHQNILHHLCIYIIPFTSSVLW